MNKLKKTQIDALLGKPQSKQLELTDGNNLYLIVTKIGSCKFKYRHRTPEKATWLVIGDYPDISLNEARQIALKYRGMINKGMDPKIAEEKEKAKCITLNQLAERYFKECMPSVRTKEASSKHFTQAVKSNILKSIGHMFVPHITDEIIRNKLINPKLESGHPSSAKRIKINLKILLDFAIDLGIIDVNPTAKIKSSKIYSDKPRQRHLSLDEIKTFLNLVYATPTKTPYKFALHLLLLLLTRKTELLHATWDSVDVAQRTFTIKESKMGTQLVIPLPDQAIKMFEKLRLLSQGIKYIFIGRSGINSPISTITLNRMLTPINQQMFSTNKDKYFTVHDLRRTGATVLGELGYPSDYIEVALNHSKVGMKQIYQRSKYLEQRKEMLQKWADILDSLIKPELHPYDKHFII